MVRLPESRRSSAWLTLSLSALVAALAMQPAAYAQLPDPSVPIELTVQSGSPLPPPIALPIWNSTYDWPAGDGYNTWSTLKSTALPQGYQLEPGLPGQPGLWLWPIGSPAAGGNKYPPGYAEYAFRTPGSTRIARASIDTSFRPALYNHHCTDLGLRTDSALIQRTRDCVPPTPGQTTSEAGGPVHHRTVALFDPSAAPSSKELYVRLEKPSCENGNQLACLKWIPDNNPTDGSFLRAEKVAMTLVDDDLPVVTPSGAFFDLKDRYIDGKQSYPLQIDSTDAGAGIYAQQFDHTLPTPPATIETLGEKNSTCDPAHNTQVLGSRICPPNESLPLTIDTNPFPEGTNKFRAWAVDPARNIGESLWNVIVDRTPPPAPPNIRFLTPDEGSGQADWDTSIDPILADGTPASGTTHYRYRSQVNGGAWTDWNEIDAPRQITDEVFDRPIGTAVGFEVVAVDLVGNVSEPSVVSGVVTGEYPDLHLGGALAATDNDFTSGQLPINLDVTVTDATSGVRRIQLSHEGVGPIVESIVPCVDAFVVFAPGKLACPASFSASFPVDVTSWGEGEHVVTARATDRATNEDNDELTIYVDRSGPTAPSDLDIALETDVMQAAVTWGDGSDPQLADGSDPSGTRESQYRYRTVGSGAWTDWIATQEEGFDIPGVSLGDQYELQVRSVDEVGNIGSTTSQVLTVDQELPQSGRLRVCADDAVWLGNNASSSTTIHSLNNVTIYARHSSGKLYTLRTTQNSVAGPGCTQVRLIEGNYSLNAYYGSNPISFRTEQHPNTTTGHNGLTQVSMNLPHSSGTSDYVSAWAGYYAGSDLRDCRSGGSCGHFDRAAAGQYGLTYGNDQNPPGYQYEDGGTDCTNFVSQALRAGGMRFANEYELRSGADEGSDSQSWWYLINGTPLSDGKKRTTSWIRAEALIDHLRHRRLVSSPFKRPSFSNRKKIRARVGDVFAFNWFNEGNRVDHLAIVSEIDPDGEPQLAYHTNEHTSMPWSQFVEKTEDTTGAYGDGWTFDRYRVVDSAFND